MKKLLSSFIVGLGLCCAHPSAAMAAQDHKQAAASDPWQDATVTHINRMPMTALPALHHGERRHGGCVDKKPMVWVNIDHRQMGVGGDNTWGAMVHPEYTITPHEWSYGFTIMRM